MDFIGYDFLSSIIIFKVRTMALQTSTTTTTTIPPGKKIIIKGPLQLNLEGSESFKDDAVQ